MSTETPRAPTSDATIVHSPRAGRALIVADALQQEADQRKLLGQYIHSHMIEGTDYGVIPNTKNRTLLKPGAEKLTQLYRCIPRFVIEEKIENWETGLFYYRFSCQIVTQADDCVVAEGVGSCSTYESRYRWRTAGRVCPECGKDAIIKGKVEYGGGWVCFKKKDGCGAKFEDDDTTITDQPTGRVQNPDLLDQVNTVLKIAKKRALVDAAIALARCSDIFTQDIEDMVPVEEPPPAARPAPAPAQAQPTAAPSKPSELAEQFAKEIAGAGSEAELKMVTDRINANLKRLSKADTNYLAPLVLNRKKQLAPAVAAPTPAAEQPAQEGEQRADFPPKPDSVPAASTPPTTATEGEQGSDPTRGSASTASTPSPSASASATVTASPAARTGAAAPAPTRSPTSPVGDDVPMAGGNIVKVLIELMHKLGVSWGQIRDGIEKGEEIAEAAGLAKMPVNFRPNDLTAAEALKLKTELEVRVAEKEKRASQRAANAAKKQAEEGAVTP